MVSSIAKLRCWSNDLKIKPRCRVLARRLADQHRAMKRHGDNGDRSGIPMAETRNYVQRVMENLQVYAARLGTSIATVEPNLHRVTTIERRAKPTFVDAIPY
jgi:hypothetical protein